MQIPMLMPFSQNVLQSAASTVSMPRARVFYEGVDAEEIGIGKETEEAAELFQISPHVCFITSVFDF